ncbi:hypothetical protein Y1Q_0001701 [Alligator mississippiensis]|uniref:Uncharacterized protein n=1 Tax=Alligator mississippiensis TaxID=8496 RepID=A0A151MAF9_ALLMI|nr:hypothetical protein Y1Q_0001701 [Alligator mississippiensis]
MKRLPKRSEFGLATHPQAGSQEALKALTKICFPSFQTASVQLLLWEVLQVLLAYEEYGPEESCHEPFLAQLLSDTKPRLAYAIGRDIFRPLT